MKQRSNYFFLETVCHSNISGRKNQWQAITTIGSTWNFVHVYKLERTVMADFIFIACFGCGWVSHSFHSRLGSVFVCWVKIRPGFADSLTHEKFPSC